MKYILDTGFIFALLVNTDKHHERVVKAISLVEGQIILPTPVIVELTYLLGAKSNQKKINFLRSLLHTPWQLECLEKQDFIRIVDIVSQYSDMQLDYVDASITAIAERLNVRRILTVDSDFRVIRPKHCKYFEVLP